MVLFSRVRAPDWSAKDSLQSEAKCRKLPTPQPARDPFFENEGAALAVCNGEDTALSYANAGAPCPMRHECLIFALVNHEGSGIWGGLPLHDRMHMKRHLPRSEWKWHPPTPEPEDDDEEACASLAA